MGVEVTATFNKVFNNKVVIGLEMSRISSPLLSERWKVRTFTQICPEKGQSNSFKIFEITSFSPALWLSININKIHISTRNIRDGEKTYADNFIWRSWKSCTPRAAYIHTTEIRKSARSLLPKKETIFLLLSVPNRGIFSWAVLSLWKIHGL